MKKVVQILSMAVIMMAAVNCGGGSSNAATNPSDVVEKAYNALLKSDFETAKKYFTKDRVKKCENTLAGEYADIVIEEHNNHVRGVSFKVVSEEIAEDGKTATVKVKLSSPQFSDVEEIPLVKENGEWKVDEKLLKD